MGGKRLKFPKRKKYVAPAKDSEVVQRENKPISQEEHEKKVAYLKSIGLLK